ncbi:MAG: hydroxyacylglutathione hydrolase [Rickettsiales bacterium]|nr:hydroxyacylglutathione hydrolase [Rickettsiales bacterium]
MSLEVHIVDMLHVNDNYNFILHESEQNITAVIDPSESDGVMSALGHLGLKLDYILNTHHHWDHTNGNETLKDLTGCQIVGYAHDAQRIPLIDIELDEGDVFSLGASKAEILFIPGHVTGHIAYHFANDKALFSGDTLFALGCGRVFEGTPQQLHQSLQKLAALPDDTIVYSAHEYTLANARFSRAVEPKNDARDAYVARAKERRQNGEPSIPTTLADEKAANPFLRCYESQIRTQLQMPDASDEEVFVALRKYKDRF